jgi:hypothetical protein
LIAGGESPGPGRIGGEATEELAEIPALQQAGEGRGRVVEPVDDVLAIFLRRPARSGGAAMARYSASRCRWSLTMKP